MTGKPLPEEPVDNSAPASAEVPIICMRDVSFTYDGEAFALSGASVQIERGEFVCILGGNGSGKSTLAKHLNALLVPDKGQVEVCGMDTSEREHTYAIRQSAGMVFQNPDDQLVASIVEDDVAFGPENLGVPTAELRQRVTQRLEDVGLSGFEKHETHALSGGQKQRVAIAGALAMNPEILILDEASAMLDPRGRKGLMRVVRSLNNQGMTVVMITHFMEEAALADRVIVLDEGKVARVGTPQKVLVDVDALSALNLEVPFAAELSQALRRAGVPVIAAVTEEALAESVFSVFSSHAAAASSAHENAAPQGPSGGKTLTEKASASPFAPKASTAAGATECAKFPASPAASTDGDVLIWLENVSFTYDAAEARRQRKAGKKPAPKQAKWGNSPEALWALDNVSLKVRNGEFLGIAGHTGSGKSTLIQHMNGILHPTSGRVVAFGSDIAEKGAANDVRGRVGVVFQYPENQLFAATVAEDVAFGPRNLGLSEEEVSKRVERSLRTVGLNPEEIAARSPFELSGGQQRRVAFAGVLAMEPEVLVLDEPAAGLDPKARKSFLDMVARLHEEGLTVVMVSHNMDDLANLCDRVAVMSEGKLLMEGAPAEVFTRAAELTSVGLATTSPEHFANLLREGGLPMPHEGLATEDSIVAYLRGLI
ncbi:energy-coupling factor transporter ATPase [Ellagibacter isourolithinifaciens]|uniref:energy-coupling factor transporter ATPase n=1 Tax=Ellagibacter isourolithinifaciens TaxID=2137581 RepID=UPI001FE65A21|nr:energy-coupling factor transporter ATPase [Ellagibacter isourolithinifaciens]